MKMICVGERFAFSRRVGAVMAFMAVGLVSMIAETRIDYMPIREPNRCLPDAVGFQMALQVQYPGTWSRILKVNWNTRVGQFSAHAYCIYEINHQLYAYDSRGGQRRLRLKASTKWDPKALGAFLGGGDYASAQYLRAFDPGRMGFAHIGEDASPQLASAN